MRIRIMTWRNIPDQIRYWDAMDLLDNLEQEMEKARSGYLHCVFLPGVNYPLYSEDVAFTQLKPEIRIKDDYLHLDFGELKDVEKDDINISLEDGIFHVRVILGEDSGKEIIGVFHMRVPPSFDPETCNAEMKNSKLSICMQKKDRKLSKRKIKVK